MLGTLDFTVSEQWAPINFPQSTALYIPFDLTNESQISCEMQ